MRYLTALIVLALAGCGGAPVETSKLKGPPGWLMTKPCGNPKIPADEGNPSSRAAYYADSRKCSSRKSKQVIGLQRYIRSVRGS